MALILFHTRNVTNALKSRAPLGIDLLLLAALAGLVAGVILFGERFTSKFTEKVTIDLSYWALPKYVLYTAMRGVAAYFLSLTFTLIYGTTAAHSPRAERVMLPVLDILQAIPVLSFLPGAVLALIAIFPHSQIGLELACILMIFTGQAWNMTFSFHGSLKSIPAPLREVASLNRYSRWQTFRWLEVPSAMIGLIWNSMMSMAGGWFFLTVTEAFVLGPHDFRLPGLGSYMAEANIRHDGGAIIAGSVAMILMIVAFDQVLWRPLVVWSQKFKLEENTEARSAQSWVLNMFHQSRLLVWIARHFKRERPVLRLPFRRRPTQPSQILDHAIPDRQPALQRIMRWVVAGAGILIALYGLVALVLLIARVPVFKPETHEDWISIILALLTSFARICVTVLLATLWTLPVGIVVGRSPRLSNFLQPIIQTLASYPAPMVFPIVTAALIALHVPFNVGCTVLLLMGAQWYILFNVIAGAMAIPADLKEVCEAYSMPKRQRWTKLYIPCVFPYLVTGLITAAGGAWNATIVAEYMTVGDKQYTAFGLGAIIAQASNGEKFPILAASTISMAVFVVLLNRFFWKHMYRLAEERYSLNA